MRTLFRLLAAVILLWASPLSLAHADTAKLKCWLVALARSYEGQGDPDQSKQRRLEVLVNKLIAENPMPPVAERLPLVAGAWKQVWGPYEYDANDGSVDPTLGFKEVYQVVFADGYYYNVAPFYPDGPGQREQIRLLRGEFELDANDPNGLQVKFTDYPGVEPRPSDVELWELPALAEAEQLENEIVVVPSEVVKISFAGGKLEEVYTDHDLRILYGTSATDTARRSLYVMTRVD